MQADYLIVGSGLTGATIARLLFDHGRDVAIVERRPHLGGNVHDHFHESGIRIHTYGPHYFRTSSDAIWKYVNRFARFYPFEAELMSVVDRTLERWPVHAEYIERVLGKSWTPERSTPGENFEESSLAMMPRLIYDTFVRGYTAKQWGVDPCCLESSLAKRFEVRTNGDARLKTSKHQGIPVGGYAAFMEHMLDGVRTCRNVDYLGNRSDFSARKLLIFTGPIDEYFGFEYGRLAYRGQRRHSSHFPSVQWKQPVCQVNYPDPEIPMIRMLEWKHMMEPELRETIQGTVVTSEAPHSPSDPWEYEYPFPDQANRTLYCRYRARAQAMDKLLVCGRLGEYRYLDMDQAIGRAMMIAKRILRGESPGRLLPL
jgi:UDP-galactopyranose mutase